MKNKQKRFFVFVGGGIGDVLMTTPMFRAIKKSYPDAYIAASVMGAEQIVILKNNKNVDDIINLSSETYLGIPGTLRMIRFLRSKGITHSLINHVGERRRFFSSAFLAGIKMRMGHNRISAARGKTYKYYVKTLTHSLPYTLDAKLNTQLNIDILKFINIQATDITYDLKAKKFDTIIKLQKKTVGLHPGCDARAKLKRWELEKFIQLGNLIKQEFDYEVKFYIGPAETDMIKSLQGYDFTVINSMPLEQVITDVSNCDFFVSNDSGLAHIAGAFSIPTIVVYGPTLKNEYLLPTTIAIQNEELKCRPCFHLRKPCAINELCLKSISTEKVFSTFCEVVQKYGTHELLKA